MKPNTNYRLRHPERSEIVSAFGSLWRCAEITGCDLPTVLFYLANSDRIAAAAPVERVHDAWSDALWEDALTERAKDEWSDLGDKPTIKRVAEKLGACRPVARRALVAAGRWPA